MSYAEFTLFLLSLKQGFAQLVSYFTDIMGSAFYAFLFWCSCLTIYFFIKFLLIPIVGRNMGSGRSDEVKKSKHSDR